MWQTHLQPVLGTHRGGCSVPLELSFFHFIPQLTATAHLRRGRLKVSLSAPGGRWGPVWAGPNWPLPPRRGPRSLRGVQARGRRHSHGDKAAPLLAPWEILDCFGQQTAPRCWAAKFPPSLGSWALNFIPSPNEKHSLKMSGHQGGRPRRAQALAASPSLACGGTCSATEQLLSPSGDVSRPLC